MPQLRISRLAGTGLAGIVAALAIAAPASAATTTCGGALSQPFSPWGDVNSYTLAKGGDFESTAGWNFAGGAIYTKGSEPFNVTGKAGKYSLSLPAGSTATSPPVCLTVNHPTFRFFAKSAQGNAASMRAEAIADWTGQTVDLGALNGTTAWAPTAPLSTGASNFVMGPDGSISVRLRFTADYGNWQIDDIFVDPRKMG